MSAVSRSFRRSTLGLIGVVVALMAAMATPASAALTVDLSLVHDAHDIQALYIDATSGQYKLTVTGADGKATAETADIAVTATTTPAQAANIQAAINLALNGIEPPGDAVSVRAASFAGGTGLTPYLITFDGGPMATKRQALIKARNGTTPPSVGIHNGVPRIYVETRSPGGINRGDERVNYMVTLKNTSAASASEASVGDVLFCSGIEDPPGTNSPKNWDPIGFEPTQYGFEWRRNGTLIAGETNKAYAVSAADEGAALQCMVKGTNATGASKWPSLQAMLVAPPASPLPSRPSSATGAASRPSIEVSGANRICKNPSLAWNPPTTWTYQWLHNGDAIPGATSATYTPDTGGADKDKVLQCMVTPIGGGAVAVSPIHVIGEVSNPPRMGATVATTPATQLNVASGLTVEVELPSDQSYLAGVAGGGLNAGFPAPGWSCVEVPASGGNPPKASCSFSGSIASGASTSVTVGVGLGPDVPDSASVDASATVPGASGSLAASSPFEVGPAREFGITPGRFSARALDALGEDATQAGGHPAMATTSVSFERVRTKFLSLGNKDRPVEQVRNATGEIPPGFVGNPQAIPDLCPNVADLFAFTCPPGSVVGELAIQAIGEGHAEDGLIFKPMALYAIEPEAGAPAQFAAIETTVKGVYVLTPKLLPGKGYSIGVEAVGVPTALPLNDLRVTICGYGANFINLGLDVFRSCKRKGDPGAYEKPFWTSQTECAAANPATLFKMDSWADPGDVKSATALSPKMTGCELVPFEPQIGLEPTTKAAESASGLNVDLTVPSDGLEDPDGLSQAHLKKTTVTLPKGMSVNPGAADGLAACTQAELGMANGVPNNNPVNCPLASKIGTAKVKTPILDETLEGSVYLAKQGENPFGSLVALYVVVESKERGILIKLPGKVEFKPDGQIVSSFDENPQAPFSSLELDFHSGPRATLLTPQKCGSYDIVSELTPWSAADPDNPTAGETVTRTSSFQVTSGPNGSACPDGSLAPKLKAGLQNPIAGASSPFVLSLSREDGSQRFDGLDVTLPPGLTAKLKGVPYCPDSVLASIPSAEGTGQAEIDNPSCPAASQIGSVSVGAGAGSPFYVNTGKAYLTGPYKGAPLSLAVVTPAVAGPFDLGNVVVRNALRVNPITTQVTVDSDPIPTHVHNLPVDIRDIRVRIDRDGFTQAPTSCEEMAVGAKVSGEQGATSELSNRFQVGECGALGFKPRLKIQLHGDTKRSSYQRLEATLTARPGDANISRTSVALPHSAFLAQEHIRTVCTRVQFAADTCPKGSIYGKAEATSPLLDGKLSGPVYLRSSNNTLPDLVVSLRGPDNQPIEVELSGRTDSINEGIRNTFDFVPDAPVTSFKLQLFGGKKSLIVNSRNLCNGPKQKATVKFSAHNGLKHSFRPVVGNDCGKKKGKKKGKTRAKG